MGVRRQERVRDGVPEMPLNPVRRFDDEREEVVELWKVMIQKYVYADFEGAIQDLYECTAPADRDDAHFDHLRDRVDGYKRILRRMNAAIDAIDNLRDNLHVLELMEAGLRQLLTAAPLGEDFNADLIECARRLDAETEPLFQRMAKWMSTIDEDNLRAEGVSQKTIDKLHGHLTWVKATREAANRVFNQPELTVFTAMHALRTWMRAKDGIDQHYRVFVATWEQMFVEKNE